MRETIPIDKSRVFYEQINDEPIDKGLSLLERFDFGREEYQAPRRLTPPILRETILRSYSPEVVDDEYGGSVYVLMAREMVSSPYARQKLEEFDQVASGQL